MIRSLQLKSLLKDRAYLATLIGVGLLILIMLVLAIIYVHPGELKVPVRYSRFDSRKYALDQWFYLLNYVFFAVIVGVMHMFVSAKLYHVKGKKFAQYFLYLAIALLLITIVFSLAIFKVVSLSQ